MPDGKVSMAQARGTDVSRETAVTPVFFANTGYIGPAPRGNPMMGISGPSSVVAIQLGYSCSDIISKCGVGLLIYQITNAKSKDMQAAGLAK